MNLKGLRVYIDTNVAIYCLERLTDFPNLKSGLIEALDAASLIGVTSELTLLETLVGPRKVNDLAGEAAFRKFLAPSARMVVRPVDSQVIERAIDLRLVGLRTPDAIHVATAILEKCDVLLTRDLDWARSGIRVVDPIDIS